MSVGRALVYGGRGALGSTVVKAFKVGFLLEQNTSVRRGLETVKVVFILPYQHRRVAGGWPVWT